MSRCDPPGSGSEDLPPGHLRRERFRAVRAKEAPVSRLIAELLLHLADLCPTCAEELAAVVQDLASSGDPNLVGAVAMTQALFEWKLDDTEASLALLTEAAALFASAGEPQREALAWTRKAMVLELAGREGEAREALAKVQEIGRGAGLADLAHTRESLLAELLAELGEDELGGAPS